MTGTVIKGGDLMLFVTVGSAKKAIGFATNHTINISADTKETSSKDSGGKWQSSEVGILSWTASSENLYAVNGPGATYDDLFNAMVARNPIDVIFGLEKSSTNYGDGKKSEVPGDGWTAPTNSGYTGKVIITGLSKNAPNGDNATFTVDFTGVGELKQAGKDVYTTKGEDKDKRPTETPTVKPLHDSNSTTGNS